MKLFRFAKQTADHLMGWLLFVVFSMMYLVVYAQLSGNIYSHLALAVSIYIVVSLITYLIVPTIKQKTQHPLTYFIIPFSFIMSFAIYFFWGDWFAFQMVKCAAHLSVLLALSIYVDVAWHSKL